MSLHHYMWVIILALLISAKPVAGQQATTAELSVLRQHLRLPASASISQPASLALPSSSLPLRIFVVAGDDLKVRDNLLQWIGQWNAGEGQRHGRLSVVESLTALSRCNDK